MRRASSQPTRCFPRFASGTIRGDICRRTLWTSSLRWAFFGVLTGKEYDGLGLNLTAYAITAEELYRAWMSVGSIIARGQSRAGATGTEG